MPPPSPPRNISDLNNLQHDDDSSNNSADFHIVDSSILSDRDTKKAKKSSPRKKVPPLKVPPILSGRGEPSNKGVSHHVSKKEHDYENYEDDYEEEDDNPISDIREITLTARDRYALLYV